VKVLIDVSAGQAIAEVLRNLGHDVVSVRDRDPRMGDADILTWAVAESRLVVTMDKDFGELVYRGGQAHHGVLLLRLEDAGIAEKERVTREVLINYGDQLAGRFSVYQDGRLRIR
jgi:predicted nuclease of predicted toxin-antitoxin system